MPTSLLPDREEALARAASDDLDILVVGGGITGAGVALDAVSRGYRVGLVERDDLASGTSSRSSKLVHGGVRYLETGDLPMVVEGVRERERLRRLAPHLVRPLGFVIPVDDRSARMQLKLGLLVYDALAAGRRVRRHDYLTPGEVLHAVPGLVGGFSRGAYRYYDCQTDDARLTLQVAQIARRLGALVVNHAEVTALTTSAAGRVEGAEVTDRCSGERATLRARWVVSASGVWADRIRGLAPAPVPAALTPSKGIHLVFRQVDLPLHQAAIIPSGHGDGRRTLVVPWGQQVYVGTTDAPDDSDQDRPEVRQADAAYLLGAVNAAFGTDLTVTDAVGAWAGVRPLLTGRGASVDLSRRHAITEDPAGLVTVTGGKLTTYRRMAQDVVDHLARAEGHPSGCLTTDLTLGAVGAPERGLARVQAMAHGRCSPVLAAGLYHRHGDLAPAVLDACAAEPNGLEPLVAGLPYLTGEARWAVRHEMARTVSDVLMRRLRVSLRDAAAGGGAVAFVADVIAQERGLSAAQRRDQIDEYVAAVGHERGPVPLDRRWMGSSAAAPSRAAT